ncbi:MAG TPA: M6 family metalloprotease domain-containing protein [Steroidobacter sp.]|uniref:M6 family metalloprotease domain-containing protein n=1 Tax=Steroidobacter sp. TaxID=1978227 RepID=UPI002EDAA9B6
MKPLSLVRSRAALALATVLCIDSAIATPPPRGGGSLPTAFQQRAEALPANVPAFTYNRSLTQVTQRALLARAIAQMTLVSPQGLPDAQEEAIAKIFGSVANLAEAQHVNGRREVPVITIKFAEHGKPPYPATNLQTQLFDGPWPTGTMRDYYREISGGRLNLTGKVTAWVTAAKKSMHYEGADFVNEETGEKEPCFGMCDTNKVGQLLSEALSAPANAAIDWGRYDNDGPDGAPNSGDDDGYVDFVAFVHSESGGECDVPGNRNIWSHRWNLASLAGSAHQTSSARHGGGFIMIDDYVIQPGLACDNKTMIEIGVFAHEFAHAFGLPDLYDTDGSNGESAGVGNWCLMAGGSWGGDGRSPQRPSHMSPWAKEFLGWIDARNVVADQVGASLQEIQDSRLAYRMGISSKMYYLLANVQQRGFNDKLPAAGLQIWKINQTVIDSAIRNNRVNANEFNRGVELVEADGNKSLNDPAERGQPGDVFPGTSNATLFDVNTTPASVGRIAVCNISAPAAAMTMDLRVSRNTCAPAAAPLPSGPPEQVSSAEEPASDLAALQALAEGTHVRAVGVLENIGGDYFKARDRKIALVSEDGTAIEVLVDKPLEPRLPQNPKQQEGLSSLLGKPVVVDAVVKWTETAKGREMKLDVVSVEPTTSQQ